MGCPPAGALGGARAASSSNLAAASGGSQSWWPSGSFSSVHLSGSFLGTLGALVAGSLGAGSRRPSLCLDSASGPSPGRAASSCCHAPALSRAASAASCLLPTCLICLEALSPEEFESGEAIYQACACKGDVAVRHRHCAVQWSQVKRSTVCDVCRVQIANLPDLPPPEPSVTGPAGGAGGPAAGGGAAWDALALAEPPSAADYLIDCVRVTWMTLVVCILFFDLPVSRALLIGALAGITFTAAARALTMARRSAAAVRGFAAALRERASAHSMQQLQLQRQFSGDGEYDDEDDDDEEEDYDEEEGARPSGSGSGPSAVRIDIPSSALTRPTQHEPLPSPRASTALTMGSGGGPSGSRQDATVIEIPQQALSGQ